MTRPLFVFAKNDYITINDDGHMKHIFGEKCTPEIRSISGNIDNVKNFLRNNSINKVDNNGNSLLHYAMDDGNSKIISFLLQNGIDLHLRNVKGNTCLHVAARYGHCNSIKELVKYNINEQNEEGFTLTGGLRLLHCILHQNLVIVNVYRNYLIMVLINIFRIMMVKRRLKLQIVI